MPSPVADEIASTGLLRWPACLARSGSTARVSSVVRSTTRSSLEYTTTAGRERSTGLNCRSSLTSTS